MLAGGGGHRGARRAASGRRRADGRTVDVDDPGAARRTTTHDADPADPPTTATADGLDERRPGRIVRRKVHTADPMTVDEALSRMELVGHDFYLFADADSGEPRVVYRRKGYDYGVIRLAH